MFFGFPDENTFIKAFVCEKIYCKYPFNPMRVKLNDMRITLDDFPDSYLEILCELLKTDYSINVETPQELRRICRE